MRPAGEPLVVARQGGEQRAEPQRRVVALVARPGVRRPARDRHPEPRRAALGDGDAEVGGLGDDAPVADVPVLDERAGARLAALLADREVQDERAAQRRQGAQRAGAGDLAGEAALHVGGAAPPDRAVALLAAERVDRPALPLARRHGVHVTVEDQPRLVGLAGQHRGDRVPAGQRIDERELAARAGEQLLHALGHGRLAVGGVDARRGHELGQRARDGGGPEVGRRGEVFGGDRGQAHGPPGVSRRS
jgi:hypothetical protein